MTADHVLHEADHLHMSCFDFLRFRFNIVQFLFIYVGEWFECVPLVLKTMSPTLVISQC